MTTDHETMDASVTQQRRSQHSRESPLVLGNNTTWLDSDDIVHICVGTQKHRDGETYTKQDALDAKDAIDTLTPHLSRLYTVCDMRNARRISSEARRVQSSSRTERLALLVDNPVSRMLGNVYLGIHGGNFPTRLFTNEDKAHRWLMDAKGGTNDD